MDCQHSLHLHRANLHWNNDAMPESLDYGDVYFSRADALGESSHVFVHGNSLPERFAALAAGSHFIIGELGFGSGLNFLNTARLWDTTCPPDSCLHYVACEKHPLSKADLQTLHRHFPELARYSELLTLQYPEHTAGVHQLRLGFANTRILLTLLYGDANTLLGAYANTAGFKMHAWYLDGFSPKLNPELWALPLLETVGKLSDHNTSLSTYSVAAPVRQALTAAGFHWIKAPGYALKRHMLTARKHSGNPPCSGAVSSTRHAIVVGGGLAGCSTAFALAESGWQVSLLDREAALATQASGNPQGILHFRPVKRLAPDNHFNLFAFLFASRFYRSLQHTHQLQWHGCGHLQLASTAGLLERFNGIMDEQLYPAELMQLLTAEQASAQAGVALRYPALFFPDSGWLSPPQLCALFASHPGITVSYGADVTAFAPDAAAWQVSYQQAGKSTALTADALVLANSADAYLFPQLRHLPLISNRGQVDVYANTGLQTRSVICGQSYLVPASDGVQSIGGSYFLGDHSDSAERERGRWHLAQLADLSPAAQSALQPTLLQTRRTGTRSITPDRMPLIGQALDNYPGLYLNLAHGSHGLTRTPICAYWLASLINNTPPPALPEIATLLSPTRYK